MTLLRRSERILAAYYLYTSVLAVTLPLRPGVRTVTLLVNALVLGGLWFAAWADSFRRGRLLGTLRDWFPFPLFLLAYREMGWFAPAHHTYELERQWIVWDRWVLRDLGLKTALESLGPLLPSILEISYSLVYTLGMFAMAMLYLYAAKLGWNDLRERADRLLFGVAIAVLASYAQFPFWPSEPPRAVFPGEDFPAYITVFRRFNWWLLGGYGIHTSVFPSAHVSGAFGAAFGAMYALPERPWVHRFLIAMSISIALATVCGRYHYVVDALAGFAVALLAWICLRWAFRRDTIERTRS